MDIAMCLKYLLLISLGVIAINSTTIGRRVNEQNNFTQIGAKIYFIEDTQRVNWFGASNFCRQLGGFLVTLETESELQLLSPYLHPSRSYWISLNDLAVSGVYTSQATGRDAEYFNWSVGQPDNIGGLEHCVELWRSNSFQMNDVQCEIKLNFVCELVPDLG
ncbi:C-type lectin 37Db [Drosophila innubila]|uniref:C-type lectin 37Db n=1 Tax=Drosophila innubila TaxID=198719 RepID=UPI00148D35F9|nr:C-type lectin 37Db [Drosophila innubila]